MLTEDMKQAWMQTASGKKFHFFDPDENAFDINDIAASLAKQCRFNGHTRDFYSVAQHSVYVSRIVSPRAKFWGLMHDAYEAYLSDVIQPMKCHFPLFKAAENAGLTALIKAFNIPWDEEIEAEVHAADRYMLFLEAEHQLSNPELLKEWKLPRIPFTPAVAIDDIRGWMPLAAETTFKGEFHYLCHSRG